MPLPFLKSFIATDETSRCRCSSSQSNEIILPQSSHPAPLNVRFPLRSSLDGGNEGVEHVFPHSDGRAAPAPRRKREVWHAFPQAGRRAVASSWRKRGVEHAFPLVRGRQHRRRDVNGGFSAFLRTPASRQHRRRDGNKELSTFFRTSASAPLQEPSHTHLLPKSPARKPGLDGLTRMRLSLQ